jgi:hypothetical protein
MMDLRGTGERNNPILPSIINTEANWKNACTDVDSRTLPDDIAHVVLLRRSGDAKVVHGAAVSAYGDQ